MSTICFAQSEDSLSLITETPDTIYLYEEPIVVNKTIYVHTFITKKESPFYLSIMAGISTNKDHYDVCPEEDCKKHLNNVKQTTRPYFNNSYGLTVAYSPQKIHSEVGVFYSVYRDNFKYTDSASIYFNNINKYQYLDINITSGYWFNKGQSKFSFLAKGGISISTLLQASGKTLSKLNTGDVINLTDELSFYKYTYRALADIKTLYKFTDQVFAQLGVYYAYDIRSIISSKDLYTRQRNVFGVSLGLTYHF